MIQSVKLGELEGRGLFLLSLPSWEDWPRDLQGLASREHVLLVVADALGVDDETVTEAARRAIGAGARYVVAWGPGCERVHDLFDQVIVHEHFRGAETVDDVILTTWHADDSLEEALWFFLAAATPAAVYEASCRSWVAVVVGSAEWSSRVEAALRDAAEFVRRG